jgi:hypothetical protein
MWSIPEHTAHDRRILAFRLGPRSLKTRYFIIEIGGFIRHRFSSVDIGTRAKDPYGLAARCHVHRPARIPRVYRLS